MERLTLLEEARAAGLEVRAEGDRLVVRGPRSAAVLARRVLAHKDEVLDELRRPVQPASPRGLLVVETAELPAWAYGGDPEPARTSGRYGDVPRAICWACEGGRWWRLRTGGPWVCPTCHPPGAAIGALEWWGGEVQP